jgi:DNA (cytosine-5)-methyltransferase 1
MAGAISVAAGNAASLEEASDRHHYSAIAQATADRLPTGLCAVDLFAGAGGFSLGAGWAGIDVVAGVENNPHACATYKRNLIDTGFSNGRLFDEDIMCLRPEELMQKSGLSRGRCNVLLGGPPCQGFSKHRLKDAGVDDPRNRLLLRYFDYVEAIQPECFLVENVPGMLWPRHASYLREFYSLAAYHDYAIYDPIVLNAKDFGVPQNRKRVFILGFRTGISSVYAWPSSLQENSVADAGSNNSFDVFRPAFPGDPNDIHMHHSKELIEAFARTPPNGGSRFQSGRTLACHQDHSGHYDVYGRINPKLPGPTMTTACINPSKGRFVHPTEPHGITIRQAARFQTFPDWYIFQGGLMSAGEQIGNAVPAEMARHLLRAITSRASSSHLGMGIRQWTR